jgi:hypothetical protein
VDDGANVRSGAVTPPDRLDLTSTSAQVRHHVCEAAAKMAAEDALNGRGGVVMSADIVDTTSCADPTMQCL